jgi:hypothetical protein
VAKFSKKEIRSREDDLNLVMDAKNLADLEERRPEVVRKISALLEVGHTAEQVGQVIRRRNPQQWIESKFAESVARALINRLLINS